MREKNADELIQKNIIW